MWREVLAFSGLAFLCAGVPVFLDLAALALCCGAGSLGGCALMAVAAVKAHSTQTTPRHRMPFLAKRLFGSGCVFGAFMLGSLNPVS